MSFYKIGTKYVWTALILKKKKNPPNITIYFKVLVPVHNFSYVLGKNEFIYNLLSTDQYIANSQVDQRLQI